MPYIKFMNVPADVIARLAAEYTAELSAVSGAPAAAFHFIDTGTLISGGPIPKDKLALIEISLYPRPVEQLQKIAETLSKGLQAEGYEEVSVLFQNIEDPARHYKNGIQYR